MSRFILNGCSYGYTWENSHELALRLGYTDFVNLSINGSSNDRILRSTFEYVIANPETNFVMLMLTFYDRQEAPWAYFTEYERCWVSYSPSNNFMDVGNEPFRPNAEKASRYQKYIEERYKVDIQDRYVEKTIIDLITMTAWLDQQNIRYCIFNTCEYVYEHRSVYLRKKLDILKKNKKIIDLENFRSNEWMYQNGAITPEREHIFWRKHHEGIIPPHIAHYGPDGYAKLNDFLYNYITNEC